MPSSPGPADTESSTTTTPSPSYLHGHHPAVLRSHTWRTAANSCAYLLPYLDNLPRDRTARILDIGCGPGNITVDIARLYPHAQVVGLDTAAAERDGVLDMARDLARKQGVANVRFVAGDVMDLGGVEERCGFGGEAGKGDEETGGRGAEGWDVIHIHQLLQHLASPVDALRSVFRCARARSKNKHRTLVAAREADMAALLIYPALPSLCPAFNDMYTRTARSAGGNPAAGRYLHAWFRAAGFDAGNMAKGAGSWCFSSREEREWWGGLWAERVCSGEFRKRALEGGGTEEELQAVSEGWREWVREEDGWCVLVHGEVVAWV